MTPDAPARKRLGWRYWPTVYWYEAGRVLRRIWADWIGDDR